MNNSINTQSKTISAEMKTIEKLFEKDNGAILYTTLYSWQGHSLESKQTYRGIMSDSDSAYEWFKKLKDVEFCENQKYFGVTLISEEREYTSECGAYDEFEVYTKYYIKKSVILWAIKNCKNERHLINTLRKNFKKA